MIKILIADEIDLCGPEKLSSKKFLIKYEFGISNADILKHYSGYDILVIRSIRKIDKNFLKGSSFRVIATCTKGTDHVDTDYAEKRGITILNAEEGNHISAAEHTIALLLSIAKKIVLSNELVRKNKFSEYGYERFELFGKSIGIIGFGKVGSYVGMLCRSFGMKIYANDIDKNVIRRNKTFEFTDLNFIFKNCNFITIHIPLNKKNFQFISKERLKLLNKNSVIINTSRGDVIDEKYLLKLLTEKKIKYAGLDVFSEEPDINKSILKLDNAVLTNHIAGKTIESRRRISESVFEKIDKIFS